MTISSAGEPEITISDNSGAGDDQTIAFNTDLSAFRPGTPDSELVRPSYADDRKYVDLTNSGVATLRISNIQVNALGVSIDYDFATGGDILLNPDQTQRISLSYAPTAADQEFNLADGLVIISNATNAPNAQVALAGQSTFNADINYDREVGIGDIGPLVANWGGSDPTADINGDGSIGIGDIGLLSAQWGLVLS